MVCPKCGNPMLETKWRPPPGYDPQLREFRCKWCEWEIYVIPENYRLKEEEVESWSTNR